MRAHRSLALTLSAALAGTGAAAAQSINVDVGAPGTDSPDSDYGGAAHQRGVWGQIDGLAGGGPLPAPDGSPTLASIHVGGGAGNGGFDHPETTGGDELLLDDFQDVGLQHSSSFLYCMNFEPGTYEVYTYAWAPDDPNARTEIRVATPPTEPGQAVGGPWPGGHARGVTFARHRVDMGGVTPIIATSLTLGANGRVSGIQFRKHEGQRYCTATPNSTGAAAELIASGSASVSANDLLLTADPVPEQPGIFYYGPNQIELPFGNGFRCVGGGVFRLPTSVASGGVLAHELDITSPPSPAGQIHAGSTWNFQAWFRDPAAGGANFDLSDGVSVTFGA